MNINILKTLMEKENISMYRLSKLSGIENKSIWNIVNNKRKDPQISTVVKIVITVGIPYLENGLQELVLNVKKMCN